MTNQKDNEVVEATNVEDASDISSENDIEVQSVNTTSTSSDKGLMKTLNGYEVCDSFARLFTEPIGIHKQGNTNEYVGYVDDENFDVELITGLSFIVVPAYSSNQNASEPPTLTIKKRYGLNGETVETMFSKPIAQRDTRGFSSSYNGILNEYFEGYNWLQGLAQTPTRVIYDGNKFITDYLAIDASAFDLPIFKVPCDMVPTLPSDAYKVNVYVNNSGDIFLVKAT